MADRDEDFNTRYAVYRGYVMAYERTTLIPRRTAEVSLTRMVAAAHADTVDAVVDHFIGRFLRVPLAAKDRTVLVEFLHDKLHESTVQPSEALEPALRELLYLVLSLPEYQLGRVDGLERQDGLESLESLEGSTPDRPDRPDHPDPRVKTDEHLSLFPA